MGCAMSQAECPDGPQVFRVYNLDAQGQERSAGKIEISAQDLVLYQRGKDPVRWPLRSLRRYGFDAELFSFESGRRCPTGPGIYAFKCRRAEALFNLLQEFIARAGQEEGQAPPLPRGGGEAGRQLLLPLTHHEYMNGGGQVRGAGHEYVNTVLSQMHGAWPLSDSGVSLSVPSVRSGEHIIQYAELDLPPTGSEEGASGPLPPLAGGPPCPSAAEDCRGALYVNEAPLRLSSLQQQPQHNYANLGLHAPPPAPREAPEVQYTQLDLQGSRENLASSPPTPSPAPDSPSSAPRKTDSYAVIDIGRTQALHARHALKDDGVRKTRHNSSIDELN